MIPANRNSKISELVTELVVRTRKSLDDNQGSLQGRKDRESVMEFINGMKQHTGLNLGIEITGDVGSVNLGVGSRVLATGHNTTRFTSGTYVRDRLLEQAKLPELLNLSVDLKKLKISGSFVDKQSHTLHIPTGMFNPRFTFTDDEIVAMVVHEIGHMFSTYINMGDYLWLNFYLTEGVEVLQGHTRTKVKSELFNEAWLLKNLSPEELGNFTYGRTDPTEARRVAMYAARKLPRHHLTDNPLTAMLREEQFADLFASRLGHGKAFTTAIFKLRRLFGEHVAETGVVRTLANGLIMLASIPLMPILAISTMTETLPNEHLTSPMARYDHDKERIIKLKRDLISQMKQGDVDPLTTIEDIKFIDVYIKEILENRGVYQSIVTFFRPSIRKAQQNKVAEETLEMLVNNNLFIDAHLAKA